MAIDNPVYSFVDFKNRIPGIVLPAINSMAVAFQFWIPSSELSDRDKSFQFGVCNIEGTVVLSTFGDPVLTCFWGIITGIDLDMDFPIVIPADQIIPEGTIKTKNDFYKILQDNGINANGSTFLHCCDLDNVHDVDIESDKGTIHFKFYAGLYQMTLSEGGMADFINNPIVAINKCFRYCIIDGETIYTSNLFQRRGTMDDHTFVSYNSNETGYGFYYDNPLMINKNWLPLYVHKPQYPEKRSVYIRSDKKYNILSAIIEKTREVSVNWAPEKLHDRIAVMFSHDNVHFKNFLIDTDIWKKDDYNVSEDIDIVAGIPQAPAKCTITEFFEGRNSNCAKRLSCTSFPGTGGGGGCVAVGFTPVEFPDAVVGEIYDITIVLTGTEPYTIDGEATVAPSWLTTIEIVDGTLHLSGTPAPGDEAENIIISITVLNCSDSEDVTINDTINVNAAPPDLYGCGDAIGGSNLWTESTYHSYGYYYLDTDSVPSMHLLWACDTRPNRFSLYDATTNALVSTTGWVGDVNYAGPWSPPPYLHTALTGDLSFSPIAGHLYKVLVEAGPGGTSGLNDSWFINITC